MILKLVLLLAFVGMVLFAWKGWRMLPGLARGAAVIAALAGAFLAWRYPLLLAAGLAAVALLSWLSAGTQGRRSRPSR